MALLSNELTTSKKLLQRQCRCQDLSEFTANGAQTVAEGLRSKYTVFKTKIFKCERTFSHPLFKNKTLLNESNVIVAGVRPKHKAQIIPYVPWCPCRVAAQIQWWIYIHSCYVLLWHTLTGSLHVLGGRNFTFQLNMKKLLGSSRVVWGQNTYFSM